MKVKDLIEKLKTFDPELPVALADRSGCNCPDEEEAEFVELLDDLYYHKGVENKLETGSFVCIGRN